jgi:hypothetical protein
MMPVIGSRLSSAFAWFGGNNIAQNLLEAPVPAQGCGHGSGRSEDDLALAAILRHISSTIKRAQQPLPFWTICPMMDLGRARTVLGCGNPNNT